MNVNTNISPPSRKKQDASDFRMAFGNMAGELAERVPAWVNLGPEAGGTPSDALVDDPPATDTDMRMLQETTI